MRWPWGKVSREGGASTIRIWDLDGGGEPIIIREARYHDLRGIIFIRDGRGLISGGAEHRVVKHGRGRETSFFEPLLRIILWDARDGRMLRAMEPDGRALAAVGEY